MSSDKKWPTEVPSFNKVLMYEPVHAPVKIRHYFFLSLFSTICLCPATGLIALAYSIKSSAKADVNFHEKARLYSRRALFWNILSIVIGLVITAVLYCQIHQTMTIFMDQANQKKLSDNIDQYLQSITNNK